MGDRMVVVAAHLDDAVLSAGEAIATHPDVAVLTVFAGSPPPGEITPYDASCGFDESAVAMVTRAGEHQAAMGVVGADWANDAFLDHQYRHDSSLDVLRRNLERRLTQALGSPLPAVLLVPLGMGHPDHVLVGDVALDVADELPIAEVGVYEDLPYRVLDPEAAVDRVTDLECRMGRVPDLWPLSAEGALATKLEAIACYESQLSEDIGRCARVPERIWRYR